VSSTIKKVLIIVRSLSGSEGIVAKKGEVQLDYLTYKAETKSGII